MRDSLDEQIDRFLAAEAFAVGGASDNPRKYGYKVLRCYLDHGRKAYPLNPRRQPVLGQSAFAHLSELPEKVASLSIITPPAVTELLVEEAIQQGVENIWMQPGAESEKAVLAARAAGLNVIYGGACLLVVLGYRE